MLPQQLSIGLLRDLRESLIVSLSAFTILLSLAILAGLPFAPETYQNPRNIVRCFTSQDGWAYVVVQSFRQEDKSRSIGQSIHRCDIRCEPAQPVKLPVVTGVAPWAASTHGLLATSESNQLLALDCSIANKAIAAPPGLGQPMELQLTSDDTWLLVLDQVGALQAYADHAESGIKWGRLKWKVDCGIEAFAVMPDQSGVIVCRNVSGRHRLELLDIESGETLQEVSNRPTAPVKIRISPDSQFAALSSIHDVTVLSLAPGSPFKLSLQTGHNGFCEFSADSQSLLLTNRCGTQLELWNLQDRTLSRRFVDTPSIVNGAKFIDHDKFLTWGLDGRLRVWTISNENCLKAIAFE